MGLALGIEPVELGIGENVSPVIILLNKLPNCMHA